MPFVQRDAAGKISGLFTCAQVGVPNEVLPDTDASVIAFLNPPAPDPLDSWDLISLKVDFNHENRIRAGEGKAAITVAQFKTAIRNIPTPT